MTSLEQEAHDAAAVFDPRQADTSRWRRIGYRAGYLAAATPRDAKIAEAIRLLRDYEAILGGPDNEFVHGCIDNGALARRVRMFLAAEPADDGKLP